MARAFSRTLPALPTPEPRKALPMSDGRFRTTRWSLVARAGESDETSRRRALADLCEAYWFPIYAFARHLGHDPESARDLVQSFFVQVIDGTLLERADASRGRFRSYLRTCFAHFARDEGVRDRALKRGGGKAAFSLDADSAEGRFEAEQSREGDPEQQFLATWARTLLEEVLGRLAEEYEASGKGPLFQVLRPTLMGAEDSYREIAERQGSSEGAIKTAAYRLRQRFSVLLRQEIASTLEDPGDEAAIEEELRSLFGALATG